MNDIKRLFFNLTPDTLAAIVADLDGHGDSASMMRLRQATIDAAYDNCGDDFWAILDAARAERDGDLYPEEQQYCDEVAAILARQS